MHRTSYKMTLPFGVLFTTDLRLPKRFSTLEKIEHYLNATPKELETILEEDCFAYCTEENMKTVTLRVFERKQKSEYLLFGFIEDELIVLQWSSKYKEVFIVPNTIGNKAYEYVEQQTATEETTYHIDPLKVDLGTMIYKTYVQLRRV